MIYDWLTLFKENDFDMISSSDAKYVQIIHTSAGSYGVKESRGHADFFPNSGSNQAGCELELPGTRDVCSHRRAWIYYQESVKNPKSFIAIKCNSYSEFLNGTCTNEKAFMGFTDDIELEEKGNFYLVTHPNHFGTTAMGNEGLSIRKMLIIAEGNEIEERNPFRPYGVNIDGGDEEHYVGNQMIAEETFLENFQQQATFN